MVLQAGSKVHGSLVRIPMRQRLWWSYDQAGPVEGLLVMRSSNAESSFRLRKLVVRWLQTSRWWLGFRPTSNGRQWFWTSRSGFRWLHRGGCTRGRCGGCGWEIGGIPRFSVLSFCRGTPLWLLCFMCFFTAFLSSSPPLIGFFWLSV